MKKIINTMEEALIMDLESMYCAESKLIHKLNNVLRVISSSRLRDVLSTYLDSSANKKIKVNRIFSYLNHEPKACAASVIDEMIEDIFNHISFAGECKVQDLLITKCLQRINNYKLSIYQSSLLYTEELELHTASGLLSTIIEWEQEARTCLADISVSQMNNCSPQRLS